MEGMSSGVTVIGAEAPSAYHVAPRTENPNQNQNPSQVTGSLSMVTSPMGLGMAGSLEKKKRGRPRKYGPEGPVALSPVPISSSAPPASNHSTGKRGRGRPAGSENKQQKRVDLGNIGELTASSVGSSFMPHVITVNAGEDVTMKVISFSQQGPRAICILSANGVISNVTLHQPDSSGGTLTYEGIFEILSLSGSFMPTESQGTRSRSGGMSVSLASPDGRVVGGGVAGLLIAASPVQVVVGSFLTGTQQEPKNKRQPKHDLTPEPTVPAPLPASGAEKEQVIGGFGHQNSGIQIPNIGSPSSIQRDSWMNMHSMQDSRKSTTDINISLPGG